MGIFTNNYYDSRNQYFVSENSIMEETIDTPSVYDGKYDYTMESAFNIIAENEQNNTEFMKAIGLAELASFVDTGSDVLIGEAAGGIFDTIVKFLKSIWEKIKSIFRKFIAAIDSHALSNKDFVKKYKKYLMSNDVLKDFKFDGYKFKNLDSAPSGIDTSLVSEKIIEKVINTFDSIDRTFSNSIKGAMNDPETFFKSGTDYKFRQGVDSGDPAKINSTEVEDDKILSKMKTKVEENWDDTHLPNIYTYVYHAWTGASTKIDDTEELSKELFEYYRDGNSSKESLDENDIHIMEILTQLETVDKYKTETNKTFKNIQKAFDKDIKMFEKFSLAATRHLPSAKDEDPDPSKRKKLVVKYNEFNWFGNVCYKITTAAKNATTVCINAWLKALDDRSKQGKAICVKVINRGTNVQLNSAYGDYDEHSYRSMNEYASGLFSNVASKFK